MDAFGHVNNTVYFRYMEQARLEWFYSLFPGRNLFADGTGPVIVNASCTFIVPLVYPGDLEIRLFLGGPGRTSIGSFCEIRRGPTLAAEGAARIVWVSVDTGRPVPLPEIVLATVR